MNAVISYDDFIEYMGYRRDNNVIIPIILIRPSVFIMANNEFPIDRIFEYFHCRTGRITFFLPGYAHYPSFEYRDFLSPYRPYDDNAFAFEFTSRERFFYSQQAFTDFVKKIEDSNQNFRYNGDTELLFAKYNSERLELDSIKELKSRLANSW